MKVTFEDRPALHGTRIAIATLDAPRQLNALSLPMIEALLDQFYRWATDAAVVCVLLRGNGPKAFCAGGDVRKLAEACRSEHGTIPSLAERFFADEYRLIHRMHYYPKPLICWGHGYVMGGGMGLLQAGTFRIVTPDCRLAMPEVSIGLHTDVGASWFLPRLPGRLGLFVSPVHRSTRAMRWTSTSPIAVCAKISRPSCWTAWCRSIGKSRPTASCTACCEHSADRPPSGCRMPVCCHGAHGSTSCWTWLNYPMRGRH